MNYGGTANRVEATPVLEQRALFGAPGTFWGNLLMAKAIKKPPSPLRAKYQQLEDVVGCKWSVSVLLAIGAGITRPGALERHIEGISTKVLSERLRKLTHYGLLSKQVHAEVPPRTDYALTANGQKLVGILQQIKELDAKMYPLERGAPAEANSRSGADDRELGETSSAKQSIQP